MKQWRTPLLQTDCLYDEFWKALKQFRVWCKSYSWCDVLESKPARLKKTAGGLGGSQPPPFANTTSLWRFWEGSYGFCLCRQDAKKRGTTSPIGNRLPLRWVLKSSKTILCLVQVFFMVSCSWKQACTA